MILLFERRDPGIKRIHQVYGVHQEDESHWLKEALQESWCSYDVGHWELGLELTGERVHLKESLRTDAKRQAGECLKEKDPLREKEKQNTREEDLNSRRMFVGPIHWVHWWEDYSTVDSPYPHCYFHSETK